MDKEEFVNKFNQIRSEGYEVMVIPQQDYMISTTGSISRNVCWATDYGIDSFDDIYGDNIVLRLYENDEYRGSQCMNINNIETIMPYKI